MCRCRMGNPKRNSVFICLKCLDWKFTYIQGIQRPNTKELDHIKNLSCLCVHMQYKTKNLEVRWCDDYKERMERAIEICRNFYDSDGNYIGKYDPECMPLELRKAN